MKKQFHLTKTGVTELQTELDELKASRIGIAEKIKIARDFGDLSENAEYAAAREDQGRVEGRISELENILLNVELIKENKNHDKVNLGNTVTLKGARGKSTQFSVVGTVEADPLSGKISDESPIGKALLGKKVGEEVEITTPGGVNKFVVEAIA